MKIHSPRHLRRRANLLLAISEAGGATQLSMLVDTPKSHISACSSGSRGIGDSLAAKIESKLDKEPGWMDEDHGPLDGDTTIEGAAKVIQDRAGTPLLSKPKRPDSAFDERALSEILQFADPSERREQYEKFRVYVQRGRRSKRISSERAEQLNSALDRLEDSDEAQQ